MKLGMTEPFVSLKAIREMHEQVEKWGKYYTDDIEKKICKRDYILD